ncbi:hypothetical protein [Parvibaculum sp.]|uniref:hypothetical protein n=1 Tax=Parvibaculum sp. TaxID=2024848 RepID=UPI0027315FE9|nr:hypothetical protein [Parvibaculum sp.]MDP1628835.1 hypothetical protein [Parvibaculum sp.]MDP2148230.1 hypothetical protein [Parvibaculum sp.]MDP3326652.1 hypothetical protein [Parvibaculum sp.]
MNTRDLFGGHSRAEQPPLKYPVELECDVQVIRELSVRLTFIAGGKEILEWVPLKLIRFRGNGEPRLGAQVLDIERFKAREIGAL